MPGRWRGAPNPALFTPEGSRQSSPITYNRFTMEKILPAVLLLLLALTGPALAQPRSRKLLDAVANAKATATSYGGGLQALAAVHVGVRNAERT